MIVVLSVLQNLELSTYKMQTWGLKTDTVYRDHQKTSHFSLFKRVLPAEIDSLSSVITWWVLRGHAVEYVSYSVLTHDLKINKTQRQKQYVEVSRGMLRKNRERETESFFSLPNWSKVTPRQIVPVCLPSGSLNHTLLSASHLHWLSATGHLFNSLIQQKQKELVQLNK